MSNELTTFDYDQLGSMADTVRSIAKSITGRMKTTLIGLIAIGRELKSARGLLKGQFTEWLDAEFTFSERTALNYINLSDLYGKYEDQISGIPIGTLYLLAAKSCPEQAIEAAIARKDAGEKVTPQDARELIDETSETNATVAEVDVDASEDEAEPEQERATPTRKPTAPKPNISPLWDEAGRCIERAMNIYRKHAQEGDDTDRVIRLLEETEEAHRYYVREVEA
jgi:hypothetical protein